ncbi:MAG: hypothetical protein ABSC53_03400 [Bacteroidota bacterium]
MKTFILLLIEIGSLLFLASFSYAQSYEYKFAEAYIKGLGYRRELEIRAETDLTDAGKEYSMINMATMRNANRGIIKLREAINILIPYSSSDNENIKTATNTIIESYRSLIDNYNLSLNNLEELTNALNSNDQNIEMGKYSRQASEITAKVEYISETLFKANTFVAYCLIDTIPDKNNHLSYLIVTSNERQNLVKELESFFGKSLQSKQENTKYTVASAIILKRLLTDEHKSKDERIKYDK